MAFGVAALVIAIMALNVRRVLVDHPYRTRVLWTAVGALAIVSLLLLEYVTTIFGQTPTTYTGVIVEATFWGFVFLGLYGWIVSNTNVALGPHPGGNCRSRS